MKITIRNGIFETNSSSTHAVSLIDTKKSFKTNHGDSERKIVSKEHKLIFFCSALNMLKYDACYDCENEAQEKGETEEIIEKNKNRIKNLYKNYEKLTIKTYCELANENIDKVTKKINSLKKLRYPAFLDYFDNDTLDGYYGSHLAIAKSIIKKPNDDHSLIEKLKNFFDDSVYIEIIENWYGGEDRDLPDEF